jgi:hypothetical protein
MFKISWLAAWFLAPGLASFIACARARLKHLQDGAQSWRQDAPPGATLVNAFIKRSDLHDMDLWVVNGSVQAFWMHALDGASEVAIVKRWLEALKNRDVRSLAAVTSYRSRSATGREAKCGRRTATHAAALESATKCLFTNAELNHALAHSPRHSGRASRDS